MKRHLILTAACLSFGLGFCASRHAQAQNLPPRFDHIMRNDFFAGFTGDVAALQRGMETTAKVLAAEPNHAEAMVWHGSGMFFQAGLAFQQGDTKKGQELWTKSLALMDRAVELEPSTIGVRIPRGASVLQASRFTPPQMARPLLERTAADYGAAFEAQKERLQAMSTHSRGELLSGLAEAWEGLGKKEESRQMLERMVREMAGTAYARRASAWLAEGTPSPAKRQCLGCHTPGK